MNKKLIITEAQHIVLQKSLVENILHTSIVEEIKLLLDTNYEPMVGVVRDGGEYFEKHMIKIKVDGESISPKSLLEYLSYKYQYSKAFLKQVVTDWMFGRIENNQLTKNVAIN